MENTLIHIPGTFIFQVIHIQSFIIYHELEHLKICLDTVIDMNETPNAVPGDNFDADIDSGYEKNFHNGLCDYDNESLYRPIVTLYLRNLLSYDC